MLIIQVNFEGAEEQTIVDFPQTVSTALPARARIFLTSTSHGILSSTLDCVFMSVLVGDRIVDEHLGSLSPLAYETETCLNLPYLRPPPVLPRRCPWTTTPRQPQMPSFEHERNASSPNDKSPSNNGASPVAAAANVSFLEGELLSSVKWEPTHAGVGTAVGDDGDSVNAAPKSWSFAARQRFECARIVRVFRYARLRMRQTLRGLALDHAELLLGAVTRTVVEVAEGRGTAVKFRAGGSARRERRPERPQATDDREPSGGSLSQAEQPGRFDLGGSEEEEDEAPGKEKQRVRRRSNPRHEARQCDAWNTRWALDVDEEDMGELCTLALDTSVLEEITGGGSGERAAEGERLVVEWRKAFRSSVILTGGSRHPTQRCAFWRYESIVQLGRFPCLDVSSLQFSAPTSTNHQLLSLRSRVQVEFPTLLLVNSVCVNPTQSRIHTKSYIFVNHVETSVGC